ncbi:RING-H2 finger protein ATL13 [Raphanus sativus]|uniref:RING-type E3 ubiquitin transferase n=1 Tax=Raphanus sativus TaxID=3726 RepID=A0A6J0M881_RAPSA|nr:RING-H2 finger protein ATL13 [Raphanus sativus]
MKFSRENMNWVISEIKTTQNLLSPSSLPRPPPPVTILPNTNFDINSKISPSILLIIIILSIIFFISGLLHLLVRFLLTPRRRDREDYFDNVTALQGQLQQLFHLHDSGVDQSFIDTLPVFHYKSIIGLKNYPFDCAVCLSEFETEDKLRLLPKCSHAFHMDCIDTWLLSHSTCPLCRSSLLSDLSPRQDPRPSFLLVLESASDHSSREIVGDRGGAACVAAGDADDVHLNAHSRSSSHLGFVGNNDLGSDSSRKDQYQDGDIESQAIKNSNTHLTRSPSLIIQSIKLKYNIKSFNHKLVSSNIITTFSYIEISIFLILFDITKTKTSTY